MQHKYLKMMRGLSPHLQLDFLIRKGQQVAREYRLQILYLRAFVLVALSLLGAVVPDPNATVLAANGVPGSYELSFDTSGPVPLTDNRLPVGQELILKAHVESSPNQPAQRGTVIFQDCELKNHPAPSAACDSGSGIWSVVFHLTVDASGNAALDYGSVSTRSTIGFRIRYIGQGSGIANGMSLSADVTWF